MSLLAKRVQFALRTTTGLQSITGVGFQPKAAIFSGVARTVDGLGSGVQLGMGYAVSSTARRSVSIATNNTGAASQNACRQDAAHAFCLVQNVAGTASVDTSFDLSSFDADGFTINVDDVAAGGALLVQALLLGGTDLTSAEVFSYDTPTVAGTPSFTGLTARPKAIFVMGCGFSAASGDTSTPGLELYNSLVAENPGGTVDSFAIGLRETNGGNPAHNGVYFLPSRTFFELLSDDTVFGEGQITGMASNGFAMDFTTGDLNPFAQSKKFFGLALGGTFRSKVLLDTAPTSNGQETITSVGVGTPKGLVALTAGYTAADTDDFNNVSLAARHVFGFASGLSEQGVQSYTAVDNAVARTRSASYSDRFIYLNSPTADTVLGSAVVDSIDSDGWKQTWSNKDGVAQYIGYMALGDPVAATAVGVSRTLLWNVRKTVSVTRSLIWNTQVLGATVSGLTFDDGNELEADVRFTGTAGHRVIFKLGDQTGSPPSGPADGTWTLSVETATGSGERVIPVTLPLNDTVYTVAVYAWNGVVYSPVPLLVKVLAVPAPGALIIQEESAGFPITTALGGFPILEANPGTGGWQEGASTTRYVGRTNPGQWRLLSSGEDIRNPTLGVPLPFTGWPAGSAGKVAVCYFPERISQLTSFKAYQEIAKP